MTEQNVEYVADRGGCDEQAYLFLLAAYGKLLAFVAKVEEYSSDGWLAREARALLAVQSDGKVS